MFAFVHEFGQLQIKAIHIVACANVLAVVEELGKCDVVACANFPRPARGWESLLLENHCLALFHPQATVAVCDGQVVAGP